jgi:PTH2 family peptidyl-tRNA hydrolase
LETLSVNQTEEFEYTQNIIIRADLKISKGKICGQVAHAAVSAAEEARRLKPKWWRSWLKEGQRKVILKTENLNQLKKLKAEAEALSLPTAIVEDKGLTEIPPGTITCLAIGPAPKDLVNKITGKLRLL